MQESVGDEFLVKLTTLLRERGETLLVGQNRLSLTASSLVFLNQCFDDLEYGTGSSEIPRRIRSYGRRCVPYLLEFFRGVTSVKLVPGTSSQFDVLINVSCFKALRVLEIKKVPVGYIRGLQSLRAQLEALTCTRSVHIAISELFVSCGGDLVSAPIQWPKLEEVNLSNNTIERLDDSLKLLPSVRVLDLSYNSIMSPEDTSVWEHLSEVSHLNLGYNRLNHVPTITNSVINFKVKYLVLRNNNLHNLEGLQTLCLLKLLDVSNNCISSISELSPLAHLKHLTSLSLVGNPVSFHPDYRLNTIARLYPVPRRERIFLDGTPLTNSELLDLGRRVQPESLLSYLPDNPRVRPHDQPNGEHLTSDMVDSSLDESSLVVERRKPKKKTRKGRRAVAREIWIEDTDDATSTADERTSTPSVAYALEHAEDLRKLERLRKLGGDEWLPGIDAIVNPEKIPAAPSATEVAAENGLPAEEDGEKEERKEEEEGAPAVPLSRTLSKISYREEHDLGTSRTSSISIASLSDEEVPDDHRFLVTMASSADDVDRSPFFIFMKEQNLFETDFSGRIVGQLEVELLRDVTMDQTPAGQPLVQLKFDYVNKKRQSRKYVLENGDECQHLMEILQQKLESNAKEVKQEVECMECLRCSAQFGKPRDPASDVICPDCGGTTVITLSPPGAQDSAVVGLNTSSLKSLSSDMVTTALDRISPAPVTSDVYVNRSPSPGFGRDSEGVGKRNVSPPIDRDDSQTSQTALYDTVYDAQTNNRAGEDDQEEAGDESQTLSQSFPTAVKSLSPAFSTSVPTQKISAPQSGGAGSPASKAKPSVQSRLSRSVSPNPNILKSLFSKLSGMTSGASGSSTDSRSASSGGDSRASTPFSRVSRLDFRLSADDFTSCDHKLKLFFEVSLFAGGDKEEFQCLLKTSVVIYGEHQEVDCVLVASNMMFYLCKLAATGSGSPEDCLACLASHPLDELQFIDHGLGHQSFRLEFSGGSGCYLFRPRDEVRCDKFLAHFLAAVRQAKSTAGSKPVRVTRDNPQTLAHIRSQVLGLTEESSAALGRRLYEHALCFSDPPLIKDRKSLLRSYPHCFVGREFVDWLLRNGEVDSRDQATQLCQRLLDGGTMENAANKESAFEDKEHYYRFTQSNSGAEDAGSLAGSADLDTSVVLYLLANFTAGQRKTDEDPRQVGVVVTRTHIALAEENPQWPIPRYTDGAPSVKGPEFVCVAKHKITDVTTLDFYGDSPCYLGIGISDEDAPLECADSHWLLDTETASCVSALVQAIKEPWEAQFGVELQQNVHPVLTDV